MSYRRRATVRDLPLLILLVALLMLAATLVMYIGTWFEITEERDLKVVSGSVEGVFRSKGSGKAKPKIHIFVIAADGHHDLTLDDWGREIPELMNLQKGDSVRAEVTLGSIAFPDDSLWNLRGNNNTILAYADTYAHAEKTRSRDQRNVQWLGSASIALLFAAALLRRHFGSWRDEI